MTSLYVTFPHVKNVEFQQKEWCNPLPNAVSHLFQNPGSKKKKRSISQFFFLIACLQLFSIIACLQLFLSLLACSPPLRNVDSRCTTSATRKERWCLKTFHHRCANENPIFIARDFWNFYCNKKSKLAITRKKLNYVFEGDKEKSWAARYFWKWSITVCFLREFNLQAAHLRDAHGLVTRCPHTAPSPSTPSPPLDILATGTTASKFAANEQDTKQNKNLILKCINVG